MKKVFRSLFTLLLAVLMMSSLAVAAFAEEPAYRYTDGQSYKAGEGETKVYTVQVSAGANLDGAERTRQELLKDGFDAFVFQEENGRYRIMSGKFKNRYDAELYLELLKEVTKRDKAYVTDVALPDSAIEDFVANYKKDPRVVDDVKYNGWETPTGAFVDATFTEEETADLYIVRFSGGINFKAAEQRRDELAEKGFDAYVLKIPGFYIIGAGAFESREEAIALRDEIRQATGRWGTTVQQLELPVSMLG